MRLFASRRRLAALESEVDELRDQLLDMEVRFLRALLRPQTEATAANGGRAHLRVIEGGRCS